MTKENKKLLFKDLCNRLPYNVKCQFKDITYIVHDGDVPYYDNILTTRHLGLFINRSNYYIKPYLRSMNSMTAEERKEYDSFAYIDSIEIYDWLNEHHFDYRGLIEKGLAIEF